MTADGDWKALGLVGDALRLADAKATAMLAVDGVLFGLLLNGAARSSAFQTSSVGSVVLCIALVPLMLSVVFAALAVVPRRSVEGQQHSLLYWQHIASTYAAREADYVAEYQALRDDEPALQAEIAAQVWSCSVIAHRKYAAVHSSVWCFVGAFLIALVAAVLLLLEL